MSSSPRAAHVVATGACKLKRSTNARCLSAVTEAVQGSLIARHGFTSHAALTLSASLVSAKASMKDAKGALRHASTVRS